MFLLGGGGPPRQVMTGVMSTLSDVLPLSHIVGGLRLAWLGQTDDPHTALVAVPRGRGRAWRSPCARPAATPADGAQLGATAARRLSTISASWSSLATRTALTIAVADDEPWLMRQSPSTPRSIAPPVLSGSSVA